MNQPDGALIEVQLTVNGVLVEQKVPLATTLQEFLHHDLGFREVRYGCGEGVCGACMVLLNGQPVASCLSLAVQAQGSQVLTAAGLEGRPGEPEAERFRLLRDQLLGGEAFQCGYCACGVLVSATHYLDTIGSPEPEAIRTALSGNICRCGGYEQIVEAVSAAAAGQAPVPQPYPRDDLRGKLDGSVRYPTDRHLEQTLVGRVLWSEEPAAKILAIDTRQAKTVPGVEAILTYRDIPGHNLTANTLLSEDQPQLAADQVRSRGDAVALVAARTATAAREALGRIRVTYEPGPSVHNMHDALRANAPQIGPNGNVIAEFTEKKGDVAAAFDQADLVIEGTYRSGINDHACLEPEGGSGWFEGDTLVLVIPTHTPHTLRQAIARMLNMAENKVRIVAPRLGGSFGKFLMAGLEGYLALLVYHTRQPVRLVLDRQESMARSVKRHPYWGQYRLGLKRDGTFLALEADILADAGPYTGLTPHVAAIFAFEATGAYDIPNLDIRARGVLTNNLLSAPMRGYGSQQVGFGIESLVEKAARTLGLEPIALRRKNFVQHQTGGQGHKVSGSKVWLPETMAWVEEQLGSRPEAPPGWLAGRGVASVHSIYGFLYGLTDRFVVKVSVDSRGHFVVESDVSDAGTGITAGLPRLVARRLGLSKMPTYRLSQTLLSDPSGILLTRGRHPSWLAQRIFALFERGQKVGTTWLVRATSKNLTGFPGRLLNTLNSLTNRLKDIGYPYGINAFSPRIGGSRSTFMAGRAALAAAEQLLNRAAEKLAIPATDLTLTGDGVQPQTDPDRKLTWAELAAAQADGTISAVGEAHLPAGPLLDPATGNITGATDHMDGSHGCDVAVNPATGQVRILRYVACHDIGRALDPEIIRGQILGSISMGLGQALLEHIVVGDNGIQTEGLHDYLIPTSLDVPRDVKLKLLETHTGLGPHGAKGIGEAAAIVTPSAILNALYDALGIQFTEITLTPEQIVDRVSSIEALPNR